jgi:hypothetical protein
MSKEAEQIQPFYKLKVVWSNIVGDYMYELYQFNEHENGERRLCMTYTGDKAWAERIAKHHKIEVPEIKE